MDTILSKSASDQLQDEYRADEINLLEYIYVLAKKKWGIIGLTILGMGIGYIAAKLKGPRWVAEVIIAPKEIETQISPNLSSFGAFGGLVASQLNIGGNASLDKIDQLLDSRDFNARMIKRYNLLSQIYRIKWPEIYAQEWDSTAGAWKPTFRSPELLAMGEVLKGGFLKKNTESNNTMNIKVRSCDSTFSLLLARYYIQFLDEDIKTSTRNDARENVDFLEKQLITISDPLLREKLQSSIADEIEKTMVVSKEAFKIVDPVFLSQHYREIRLYPFLFGFGVFFLTIFVLILVQAFSSVRRTEEDLQLIKKIKKELFIGK